MNDDLKLLHEQLDKGIARSHQALQDLRYMRGHDELWAAGPANLLLKPTLNAYRLMRMLREREPLIMAWHNHMDGLVWNQTALPKGRWDTLRTETAAELIDGMDGGRIHLTPMQWCMQETQMYARMSEQCEQVKGPSGDRRTVRVSRLYASVFHRSSTGYEDVTRLTQKALMTEDG